VPASPASLVARRAAAAVVRRLAGVGTATLLGALTVLLVAAAASAPAAQTHRFKVGIVLTGGIHDPFEGLAYRGLGRAVKELGVEGLVLVAGPKEGSLPSFAALARRGFDLVIASSAYQVADLDMAAGEYPKVKFLLLDARVGDLPHGRQNVQGTLFKVEEGAYLAGYLAALTERRRTGPDVVSSVGGVKAPQVDRFIAGFRAGARKAAPRIRTLNAYANNFTDRRKCRSIALKQIARGSGVVLEVAGLCGLGALSAARDEHRFGIGVDVDRSGLGPHILTSVLKRLDLVVFRAVAALREGRLHTGVDKVYGLRDGAVSLGKISPRVPSGVVAGVERLRERIQAGRFPPIPTRVRSNAR
jgi:basic membrane protein A and related proteins